MGLTRFKDKAFLERALIAVFSLLLNLLLTQLKFLLSFFLKENLVKY